MLLTLRKLPIALLMARAALGLWAIRAYSATFDEPELLAVGWSYWMTGEMRLDMKHPPLALMWNAAPLLIEPLRLPDGPEWRGAFGSAFAERLFFWNGADGDALIQLARLAPLLLSLAAGAALWIRCRRAWGERPAAIALAFFCFSPSLLAHGSLATTDFALAAASLGAVLAFAGFLRAPTRGGAALAGAAGAAAFLCKYSALALGPAFIAALALAPAAGRFSKLERARLFALYGALPALAALLAVFAALPVMSQGFLYQMRVASEGAPVYAFGAIHPAGWRWFPFAALAVKSTLPELAVAGLAAVFAWRRRLKIAPEALCAGLVAAAYVALTAASGKQLGARYLLPVYSVLPLLAAYAAAELADRKRGAFAATLLAGWQAACALGAAPDFLPYFNEACGGAARGERCLSDSNLDWGQDLKRLGAFSASRGNPEIILSYFGTASPETYGLRPQHIGSHAKIQRRWMNSDAPARELLVVSRTNLQGVYAKPPGPPAWAEGLVPDARVGWSLLVYDVTRDAAAHRRLAREYERLGDAVLAARQRRRAELIERETSEVLLP